MRWSSAEARGVVLPPPGAVTWSRHKPGACSPPEETEQRAIAAWLDRLRLTWWHTPNGARSIGEGRKLASMGVRAGVPDIIVVGSPMVAIEVKRRSGGTLSAEQHAMLTALMAAGWRVYVCPGLDDALDALRVEGLVG